MYTYEEVKEILINVRKIQTEIKKLKFNLDDLLGSGDLSSMSYEEKIKGYNPHIGIERTIVKAEDIREEIQDHIMDKEKLLESINISLGVLNEVELQVINLGYFEGFNDTSIAYAINRTNQSVSLIRSRAIKKMVEILNL